MRGVGHYLLLRRKATTHWKPAKNRLKQLEGYDMSRFGPSMKKEASH